MQNEITLSVTDPNDPQTPKEIVYTRFRETADRVEFKNLTATDTLSDALVLYRTEAKRNGDSLGNKKVAAKFSRTVEVPSATGGTIRLPRIYEVSVSYPLGCPDAAMTEDRELVASLVQSEAFTDLVNHLVL